MTLRLTIGIDPGLTGAIVSLADGEPSSFTDMPTVPRASKGHQIDGFGLAARLRGLLQQHSGAYVLVILENVHSMPKQGVSSVFKFGDSFGCIKGVLAGLGQRYKLVQPERWKKHFGLVRDKENPVPESEYKDRSRLKAIDLFPSAALMLERKRDCGRAEALLMARWANDTEQVAA